MRPCGPVSDPDAAERTLEPLRARASADGWSDLLEAAEAALVPVVAASPYLARLARLVPERLRLILSQSPETSLAECLAATHALATGADVTQAKAPLRGLKADLHLLTALADLGGLWTLPQVTGALSDFADASVAAALAVAAGQERARGRLNPAQDTKKGPVPGLFALAMGKHGARELNYSSDIDLTFFYAPDALDLAAGVEAQAFVNRLVQTVAGLLSERTADGYVFRVDLRLRPDPSTTPAVVDAAAALNYYESVGQNWERAAFIKARAIAGDLDLAAGFLRDLEPFVWRRNLDYAAIADIQSIKRQIHVHRADERLEAPGANLKLGAGGIREIEFFVQTQQLILGGRDPQLRSSKTLSALRDLQRAGQVSAQAAASLDRAYRRLRSWEHRVQMLEDEQTHVLPEDAQRRARIAALSGDSSLERFDRRVERTLKLVNRRYGELFSEAEPLSLAAGSLVFTGVDNDPSTLGTLTRMGFTKPDQVASTIRSWHHGQVPATRTERGRELLTRLTPRLLEACANSGAADAAFNRFASFFHGLAAGVQIQSLFLAQPRLFELVVEVMACSPRLAATLARRPAALDALLDASFFAPLDDDSGVGRELLRVSGAAVSFEAAMDSVRRIYREQAFRVGMQVLCGAASTEEAGRAFADLADACLAALAPAALRETERLGGAFDGDVAVVAMGKLGSREMTATSDLDLMAVYAPRHDAAVSDVKGWAAETFYARFTQRLVAALSAPTGEGELYQIDLQLRPSGAKGPVAVSLNGLKAYYGGEADTWEFQALTRGRVAWATSEAFAEQVAQVTEAALRRPRDRDRTIRDVRDMRELMARERPAQGFWDLKLSPGAQIDVEFVAQCLQLVEAADGGPLRQGVVAALEALRDQGRAPAEPIGDLIDSWRLHQDLAQMFRATVGQWGDPASEPTIFQRRLALAGNVESLDDLQRRLVEVRARARAAYEKLTAPRDGKMTR